MPAHLRPVSCLVGPQPRALDPLSGAGRPSAEPGVRAEVAEGLPAAVLRGGRTSSASAPGMRGETEAQREQGCAQGHTVGPGQLAQAGSAPQTVPSLRPGPTPPHGCLSVGALPGEVENSHPG